MLTDSHCHLTDARFSEDRSNVLDRAREAGVSRIITIASNADDAATARALSEQEADVWCTAGVHPHEVASAEDEQLDRLPALLEQTRCVAVGETGLDFYYDNAPRDVQHHWFRAQLELAAAREVPVVVHSRNADADMQGFLNEFGGRVQGVLHCFTGGDALLEAALESGWYIGYGGIATFKKFSDHERLQAVPLDRLLIETDAPYLAPAPYRGKRNEPAYVRRSAERIAEIRGESFEALARATTENAARLFGLPPLEETHS